MGEVYWPCGILWRKKDDKRPIEYLFTSTSYLYYHQAMDVIKFWENKGNSDEYRLVSAWIEEQDKNNERKVVYHEFYLKPWEC